MSIEPEPIVIPVDHLIERLDAVVKLIRNHTTKDIQDVNIVLLEIYQRIIMS